MLRKLNLQGNRLWGKEAFRSYMYEHNPECDLVLGDEDYSDEEVDSGEEESEGGSE